LNTTPIPTPSADPGGAVVGDRNDDDDRLWRCRAPDRAGRILGGFVMMVAFSPLRYGPAFSPPAMPRVRRREFLRTGLVAKVPFSQYRRPLIAEVARLLRPREPGRRDHAARAGRDCMCFIIDEKSKYSCRRRRISGPPVLAKWPC
jgi:hypothetical protein